MELTKEQRDLIADIRQNGNELGALLDLLAQSKNVDQRWLSIARTSLQQGVMALVRAIERPEGFA